MARTYAVGGQKGGVGKTSLAWSIGLELHARGMTVLLVDADPQGSLRTAGASAAEEGLDVPTVAAMGEGLHRKSQLPRLAKGFDRVVVDCPPANGTILRGALMVADVALLPVTPSPVDVWALAETLEVVEGATTLRGDALKAAIVVNRRDPRTGLSRQIRESLADLEVPLLDSMIGARVAFAEALLEGRSPKGATARKEVCDLVDELENL